MKTTEFKQFHFNPGLVERKKLSNLYVHKSESEKIVRVSQHRSFGEGEKKKGVIFISPVFFPPIFLFIYGGESSRK